MTLRPIESDFLAAGRHGFFTRIGGVSTGVYEGLNCGAGSKDTIENVRSNRGKVASWFDLDGSNLRSVHQVHSAVAIHTKADDSAEPAKADAMVTATKGVALGVLSADCAPVLFEDQEAGVVGAAHSGWRGAVGGVIAATVSGMEMLGADRSRISASVGPCISQKAYEVGPEFLDEFLAEDQAYAQFFAGGTGDRMMFDLPRFVVERLREEGIAQASWTGHCTYSDPEQFFSYRRGCHNAEPDYGRLISVITP